MKENKNLDEPGQLYLFDGDSLIGVVEKEKRHPVICEEGDLAWLEVPDKTSDSLCQSKDCNEECVFCPVYQDSQKEAQ